MVCVEEEHLVDWLIDPKDENLLRLAGEFPDRMSINYFRAISNDLHYIQ